MDSSSKLIDNAVDQLSSLPGVGRKTALRLALDLLKRPEIDIEKFASSIVQMKKHIKHCKVCNNISDAETCEICLNPVRDKSLVCVVEDIRDVMAIENTQQYKGIYHVLGGVISPMDGIGPNDLAIDSLIYRAKSGAMNEVILALSATMEGDTTNFYIFKKLKEMNVSVTTISRGVSIGDELQYADEITLGRSIVNRLPYENSLVK